MTRKLMLIAVLACGVALVTTGVMAQEWDVSTDDQWCEASDAKYCEVREVTLDAWDDVVATTTNGNVEVSTWDRDEIRVVARVSVHKRSSEDARELMDAIRIEIEDGEITARGPHSRGWFSRGNNKWTVSFRITVPKDSNIEANSVNGSIRIDGVEGHVRFRTVNGEVKVIDARGDVSGGTTNGGIRVSLADDGWQGETIDLHTTNGGIKVDLPSDFSAEIDARTTNGGIRIEHPVTIKEHRRNRLRGTIGDGGSVQLKVRTTNGAVSFRRKA